MLFSSEINVQEPVPGWVDNLNGPTGLFLIAGIGVMRTAVILEEVLHFFSANLLNKSLMTATILETRRSE